MIELWGDSNMRDRNGDLVSIVEPGRPVPSVGEFVMWCDYDHMAAQGIVCGKRPTVDRSGAMVLSVRPLWSTWLWEDTPGQWTDRNGEERPAHLSEATQAAYILDVNYWKAIANSGV